MQNVENYKLLIRNLRKKYNEKLTIQTTATTVRFPKVRKSVQIRQEIQPNNGE